MSDQSDINDATAENPAFEEEPLFQIDDGLTPIEEQAYLPLEAWGPNSAIEQRLNKADALNALDVIVYDQLEPTDDEARDDALSSLSFVNFDVEADITSAEEPLVLPSQPDAIESQEMSQAEDDLARDAEQLEGQAVTHALLNREPRTRAIKRSGWKTFYVNTLLWLLPAILKVFTLVSKQAKAEHAYLPEGFTFACRIAGLDTSCTLQRTKRSWKGVDTASQAGVDYVIEFVDLDFAYDVFSATMTLKQALAARLFTTSGPNDKGVAVTYLFSALLRTFFGWRSTYRS